MQRRLSTTKSRVNHAVSCTSQRKGKKKAVVTTISVVPQTSGRPTPTKYHTAETTLSERHRPNTEKIDNTTAFVAGLAEKKKKKQETLYHQEAPKKPGQKQRCKTQHGAITPNNGKREDKRVNDCSQQCLLPSVPAEEQPGAMMPAVLCRRCPWQWSLVLSCCCC